MSFPSKIVLQLPISAPEALAQFVERCVADAVELICVVGPMAEEVEDEIDALVVGNGADVDRFILTSSHPDEPLECVISFARDWTGSGVYGEFPEVVRL